MPFKLQSTYQPAGDQPDAIRQLTEGILSGEKYQALLGVTGSGENIYHRQCHSERTTTNFGFDT